MFLLSDSSSKLQSFEGRSAISPSPHNHLVQPFQTDVLVHPARIAPHDATHSVSKNLQSKVSNEALEALSRVARLATIPPAHLQRNRAVQHKVSSAMYFTGINGTGAHMSIPTSMPINGGFVNTRNDTSLNAGVVNSTNADYSHASFQQHFQAAVKSVCEAQTPMLHQNTLLSNDRAKMIVVDLAPQTSLGNSLQQVHQPLSSPLETPCSSMNFYMPSHQVAYRQQRLQPLSHVDHSVASSARPNEAPLTSFAIASIKSDPSVHLPRGLISLASAPTAQQNLQMQTSGDSFVKTVPKSLSASSQHANMQSCHNVSEAPNVIAQQARLSEAQANINELNAIAHAKQQQGYSIAGQRSFVEANSWKPTGNSNTVVIPLTLPNSTPTNVISNDTTDQPNLCLPTAELQMAYRSSRKSCRIQGCDDFAIVRRPYCLRHSGNRLCERDGCNKCAQGSTRFCIAHGGGRRCTFPGCDKGARDKFFCAAHGGGKRCSLEGCNKSAVGGSKLCTSHGGGRRCSVEGCEKSAQSSTNFCVKHGGGKKCSFEGCVKVARGRTLYCAAVSRC